MANPIQAIPDLWFPCLCYERIFETYFGVTDLNQISWQNIVVFQDYVGICLERREPPFTIFTEHRYPHRLVELCAKTILQSAQGAHQNNKTQLNRFKFWTEHGLEAELVSIYDIVGAFGFVDRFYYIKGKHTPFLFRQTSHPLHNGRLLKPVSGYAVHDRDFMVPNCRALYSLRDFGFSVPDRLIANLPVESYFHNSRIFRRPQELRQHIVLRRQLITGPISRVQELSTTSEENSDTEDLESVS